jgi:hypothetical protein
MISIKARSRNQCASMNRVERQSLSLTLVDDMLQPMNHHHMASNAADLALLCTPMTSQNAHSAAHHSTQTLLAQPQCIRVALAGLQHSSLQACTVKMNPRWSPTRCRHAAFELELGKCNRHDDSYLVKPLMWTSSPINYIPFSSNQMSIGSRSIASTSTTRFWSEAQWST